jgi:hypothetical protein
VDWIHLFQDKEHGWALVNMAMNTQVQCNVNNFLSSCMTVIVLAIWNPNFKNTVKLSTVFIRFCNLPASIQLTLFISY